jgi:hypothetical protein
MRACIAIAAAVVLGLLSPSEEWRSRRVLFCTLEYTTENEHEVEAVSRAIAEFDGEFRRLSGLTPDQLSRGEVTIRLHPKHSDSCSLGYASMEGGVQRTPDGALAYKGVINIPGPAAHTGEVGSSSGHPMDRAFFDKLLIHEIAPVYLDLYARLRDSTFHTGTPAWFQQGCEEYLGVYRSTEYWRTKGCRVYFERLARARTIDADFGFNVCDPYNDGLVAVKFLADEFGEQAVLNIIASKESSFGKRLGAATGVSFGEFTARFDAWLAGMLARHPDQPKK